MKLFYNIYYDNDWDMGYRNFIDYYLLDLI